MKCPSCGHPAEKPVKVCPACGEAYASEDLLALSQLEYLLEETAAWGVAETLRSPYVERLQALRSRLRVERVLAPPTPVGVYRHPSGAFSMNTFGSLHQEHHRFVVFHGEGAKIVGFYTEAEADLTKETSTDIARDLLREYVVRRGLTEKLYLPPQEAEVIHNGYLVWFDPKKGYGELYITQVGEVIYGIALVAEDYGRVEDAWQATLDSFTIAPELEVAVEVEPAIAPPTPLEPEVVAEVPPTPAPPPTVVEEIAPPVPVPAPEAVPVAKPRPPLIDLGKVRERLVQAAVSGALLGGLLYLGAFMLVISAHIIVFRFRAVLPKPVLLAFLALGPGSAYFAGWGLRSRMRSPQAGAVLTAIGALLLVADFGGIYQFGGLTVDLALYWVVASAICTVIWAATAWRLPMEFFGYVALLGASSTLVWLTRVLNLPLEWQVASVAALTMGMAEGAVRLERASDRWSALARAARRLPQILVPMSVAVVLVHVVAAAPSNPTLGHSATFAFAAVSYAMLAWRFPAAMFGCAAVLSSIGAAGFALWAASLPVEWYATAAAAFSPLYVLAARWLEEQLGDDFAPRRAYLGAANLAGFALVGVAVLAGFATSVAYTWPGVIGLSLAAFALAGYTYLLRRPILVLPASALFVAPYSLAAYRWLGEFSVPQPLAWLVAAWAGLALAYLGLAVLLRGSKEHAVWLNLVAHVLTPLGSMALLVNYIQTADSWFAGPTLAALSGVMLVYLLSAVIHDSGRHPALSSPIETLLPDRLGPAIFIWPAALLLPIWLAVASWGSTLERPWLGAALAGLGLAYVGLGQLAARRKLEYRLPVHVYAYALVAAAILLAFGVAWPLLTSLYIAVGVLVALALVYRRVWEMAAAALLFIWPFQLSLTLSPLTAHAYSLAYVILAGLGYIPVAVALERVRRKLELPVYVIGYALSAYAIAISLLGRFGVYPLDLPWVGVVVPLVAAGVHVFGLYRLKHFSFAWVAPLAFAIAFGQTLSLLHVSPQYHAAAWVGLAFAYVVTERALARRTVSGAAPWWREFRLPLGVGGTAFCALGLLLTAQGTMAAFTGAPLEDYFPLLLAQTLAVLLTGLAAWLYGSRWPLYLQPWLAFFPVTLFFIGYGASLFGRALSPQQVCLSWSGLGAVQVVIAVWLDRYRERYAHGPYLAGYLLALFAILWSAPDRVANLYALGTAVVLAGASHALVHYGRHHSFDDLIGLIWRKPDTIAQRTARTGFLIFAAYVFPIWLARLLAHYQVPLAWHGVALALAAPLYIASGLALRRLRDEYSWPLYTAGYILSAIGAMVTFQDERLAIWVLSLNAVVYAASAYIFRRPFWLYLSNALVPVVALLTVHYNFQALPAPWVSGVFMILAFLYFGAGQWFDRRPREGASREGVADFAVPFYAVGYLLSAVSLAAASGDKFLALAIYSAGVMLYALSAWVFREAIFLYPAAWLAAVPYFLGMTLTPLPPAWHGLGWLPLVVAYIALGRFVFQRAPFGVKNLQTFTTAVTDPAMPFYLLAYALSVSMIALSQGDPLTLVLALISGAAVYFASAALFRLPVWLHPGLLAAHLALLAYLAVRPTGRAIYSMAPPFLVMTWATTLAGYWLSRRLPVPRQSRERKLVFPGLPGGRHIGRRELDFRAPPFVHHLITSSWAQPLFVFAAFGVVLWQALALPSFQTAILLGTGHAVLLGLFAMLLQDGALAYGSVACFALAMGYRLTGAGLPLANVLACAGGMGFGLYVVARIAERAIGTAESKIKALAVWPKPLANSAIFFTALAVIGTLPVVATYTTAVVVALAFAGALYLAIAYRGRYHALGYLGVLMIVGAWALALNVRDIRELQLYAIPVGAYLVGMGYLERRRARRRFAIVIEGSGLSVLLLTSFAQSLNGVQGFPYFVLLLIEGLLVIWWGASRMLKVPFFMGLGGSVLNVVAQVVVLVSVHEAKRWFILLGVGLVLLVAGILAERYRERIMARSQEMFEEVMTWD